MLAADRRMDEVFQPRVTAMLGTLVFQKPCQSDKICAHPF